MTRCHRLQLQMHENGCQKVFINMLRLQAYGCTEKQLHRLQRVCGIRESARPLDRQYLFNVYTHPSSSYKGAHCTIRHC